MSRISEVRAARLAATQHGIFTLAEARRAGVPESTVFDLAHIGRIDRIAPSAYRVVGAPATWRSELMAKVCSAGEEALSSHRCGAHLWHIDGWGEVRHEMSIPNPVVRVHVDAIVHRLKGIEDCDRTVIDGIPVTSIERTLIDLAAVVSMSELATALDSALVQGLTTVRKIRRRQHQLGRRGRKGAGNLALLLVEREGQRSTFANKFERRLGRLLENAGLPRPIRQFVVRDQRGVAVARPDLSYPQALVAIEADSWRWHGGRQKFDEDLRRRNKLTAQGWRVMHITWTQLTREPSSVVSEIRRTLELADV